MWCVSECSLVLLSTKPMLVPMPVAMPAVPVVPVVLQSLHTVYTRLTIVILQLQV